MMEGLEDAMRELMWHVRSRSRRRKVRANMRRTVRPSFDQWRGSSINNVVLTKADVDRMFEQHVKAHERMEREALERIIRDYEQGKTMGDWADD